MPVAGLCFDPSNPRKHSAKNMKAIKDSLRQFGQVEPLIVHELTGEVIGGNGRLAAMRELKWTHCDVIEVDLDEAQAKALSIALNRTGDLSEFDFANLGGILQELREDGMDINLLGFDLEEYDKLFLPDGGAPKETIVTTTTETKVKREAIVAGEEWLVVVECVGEDEQQELFEELRDRGLKCKIM